MATSTEPLVQAAARNNAEGGRDDESIGLAGEFGAQAWTAPARTPLFCRTR